MTQILYRYLRKKYIKTIDYDNRTEFVELEGYPFRTGNERIYFSYIHKQYITSKNKIITPNQIEKIANEVFDDVGTKFYSKLGIMNNVLKFYNKELTSESINANKSKKIREKSFNYQNNYDQQDIEFTNINTSLNITISTGNRGKSVLDKNQRKKYALFWDKIIEQSLINTK